MAMLLCPVKLIGADVLNAALEPPPPVVVVVLLPKSPAVKGTVPAVAAIIVLGRMDPLTAAFQVLVVHPDGVGVLAPIQSLFCAPLLLVQFTWLLLTVQLVMAYPACAHTEMPTLL